MERQGCDVAEQVLDRVANRLVTTDKCACNDKLPRSTKDETREVTIALTDVVLWFRVAEFSVINVWITVVMDLDEVEEDDP
jgi:hypothetical protein